MGLRPPTFVIAAFQTVPIDFKGVQWSVGACHEVW